MQQACRIGRWRNKNARRPNTGPGYHHRRPNVRYAGPAVRLIILLSLAIGWASVSPVWAQTASLEPFIGQFVGRAEVGDAQGTITEIRDMDIEIERYKQDGLTIRWVNVSLVDGRRDVPGVRRRVSEVILTPSSEGSFYVETLKKSPFQETKTLSAMAGDPVRWAVIDGDSIDFYSFQKLDDGRFELQTYVRMLTDIGLDLRFERSLDGEVTRSVQGRTVRAQQ